MNLEQLTKEARVVIKEVGEFIQQEAKTFTKSKIEHKGVNDLVSYVDKTNEAKLITGLNRIFPEAGIMAEEGIGNESGKEYCWVIDPLDGTTNFTHGLPVYAISVALVKGKEILIGVVHELNKDECFHAYQGGGAWCNEEKIEVSSVTKLSDSLLATGFPYYDFERLPKYLNILNQFMKDTHGLRRLGAASVDLCYVACGRFEGFFEYNLKPWDIMAGVLIVEEAGGKVTDFAGKQPDYSGAETIAACAMHKEMQEVIHKHWIN